MLSDQLISRAFGHAFGAVPLPMCIVDDEHRYVEANGAFRDLLGYSDEELLRRTFLELTHPEDREKDAELSRRLFAGEVPYFRLRKRWIRKDGSVVRGLLTAGLLHDPGREPWGIGVIQEAEEVDPAEPGSGVADQARRVAHDLNNLLAVVGNAADAIQSELSTNEDLEAIHVALERATSLTRTLLILGQAPKEPADTLDLHGAVRASTLLLRRFLPSGVGLELRLAEASPRVALDAARLDQILVNLVVNARDAMGESGTLTLGSAIEEGFVRLSVRDTGQGIDREGIERIFEPFFTTKPPSRGSGLGLAIVRTILEEVGGRVEVHSRVGEGTDVSLYFPVVS